MGIFRRPHSWQAWIHRNNWMDVKVEAGEKIKYRLVNDTVIPLKREEISKFVSMDYRWQDQHSPHYWLRQIIRSKNIFPQITISIDKILEIEKTLKKYFHCCGCVNKRVSKLLCSLFTNKDLIGAEMINLHVHFTE